MNQSPPKSRLILTAAALLAAGCGSSKGPYHAPVPKNSIQLPSGAALSPWKAANPAVAGGHPSALLLASEDHLFVSLNNSDASYTPRGPGLLAAVQPSTGTTAIIDLGGTSRYDCVDPGAIALDGGKLYVACTGFFDFSPTPDTRGRAIIEVDVATLAVTRTVAAPAPFQPAGLAVTPGRLWVGDSNTGNLFAIDRTSFTVVAGGEPAHPISLSCNGAYVFVPALAYIAGDLFALCSSSDGQLVRLDASTGVVKDAAPVGATPVELALTGDGRIAVSNSVSNTISFVQLGGAHLAVQKDSAGKDPIVFAGSADAEGLSARDNFLYSVTAATATVQKWDLAQSPPKLLAEVNTGDHSSPLNILALDDNQVVVSDPALGTVLGIDFSKATTP